jgi:predicted ATPase/DNA-binding SARP family transcriptional activator
MGLLHLAVLGSPEVFHDGNRLTFSLRKAQALLIYLAVEGGMHSRSKLAAFLWPDSEPHDARTALRNAIGLLRRLLADADFAPSQHSHLLSEHELLGLNPYAPLELDLDMVQQAYQKAQLHPTIPSEPERASLVAQWQHALSLVRGPFLDGFWLGEQALFDEWVQLLQHHWQVRLQLLFDRLSSWHEVAGELVQARATLVRWLALDPLQEEAYRRLMRVQLALGDASAALQVYAICRERVAEELQVEPSPETIALAEHIRATEAHLGSFPTHSSAASAARVPPSELVAPLVGRAEAFSQLMGCYQQVQEGQPQAVFIVGEAGIGKTRLADEFVAWARAQGAEALSGHAFEMGGRLPYQPLVEALRPRLEEENAPEDLLDDPWLAELSRILPELRVRYPDLPAPTEGKLAAKVRLFEAVARLLNALAQRAPLVLLLDDLHWVDGASFDLVRYLGRSWRYHGSRVLLLGTVRSEELELNATLVTQLADLGRDLPLTQVPLQTLSEAETIQLIQAIVGEGEHGMRSGGERPEHGSAGPSKERPGALPEQASLTPLVALGQWLFARTVGQPLYLLEMLKMLRDQQWLVPRLSADGTWRLELDVETAAAVVQEQSLHELLPSSVRAMIQARLAQLSPAARQLVMAGAVLGNQATTQRLWQTADVGVQAGVEALEEAVRSGLMREEAPEIGWLGSYRFAHDLVREVIYSELGEARRLVLHQRALALLQSEGARASELAYHALAAGEAEAASRYSVQAGDEAMAVFAVEDAIGHYEQARTLLQGQQRLQAVLGASEVEHLYASLGWAYAFQNAWQQAQEAYEELLAYARQQRLPTLGSRTLNRLAILAVQQSHDKPQVRALLEEARHIEQTSHDQRALAETEWNLAQITTIVWEDAQSALSHGQYALELARGIHDKELEARSLSLLGVIHMNEGYFQEAIHYLEASLALYTALGHEQTALRELSVPSLAIGAPPTQPLTNRLSEALCWGLLAFAQVHTGQVQHSIRSGRIALVRAQESKNAWAQVISTRYLTFGLLEAGAYEEALVLMLQTMALVRNFPTINLQRFLTALGSTYQALQQWEEAHSILEKAEAMAEMLDRGPSRVPILSQLCMHSALAGQWEAAYSYVLKAIAVRKSSGAALIALDFYREYETEALLRGGEERQARAEVQRLGEGLGHNQRFRIPYLRSLAVLATWEGHSKQAIGHLREAAQLAADLGLPGERWQIQAALGRLYEAVGEPEQAYTAFAEAVSIIQGLAEGIGDEALRTSFLAAPQIQQVVQQVRDRASQVPHDHA